MTKTLDYVRDRKLAPYFIQHFRKIPENRWCTGTSRLDKARDVYGHCPVFTDELDLKDPTGPVYSNGDLMALGAQFGISFREINDGKDPDYQEVSAKQRVLAALIDIRDHRPRLRMMK